MYPAGLRKMPAQRFRLPPSKRRKATAAKRTADHSLKTCVGVSVTDEDQAHHQPGYGRDAGDGTFRGSPRLTVGPGPCLLCRTGVRAG